MDKYIWPLKIAVKIVLARLPVPYKFWKKIGLFQHGKMDKSTYALNVFKNHVAKAYPEGLPAGFFYLEMGPGDTIASALIAHAYGAGKITLVDVGDFADKDPALYQKIAKELRGQGFNAPQLDDAKNFEDVLRLCNAEYFTEGLQSLKKIPAQSMDLICSQSVLEHVRKREFSETMSELARIVKPKGRIAHSIDFKDHLAYALNNLRFPEEIWENDFFANSGFYTNRLRLSEMLARFNQAGFAIMDSYSAQWPSLPTSRSKMQAPFRAMSDEDLLTRHLHVALRLKNSGQNGAAA